MKTKYETPEVSLLLFTAEDVIATSGGLQTNETYDATTGSSGTGNWGSLWD